MCIRDRYCVEDMSPEPSELIAAFVSKVPFFRGLGSGVLPEEPNRFHFRFLAKLST